ncbi:carotenoid oxygenase family protein [Pseudonocardia sp.]|uniref:carotenoid oxygenase family protein n=1 Tax=Pseudonocardia sp. TaxID=60912 RepID=UPI003D0C3D6B
MAERTAGRTAGDTGGQAGDTPRTARTGNVFLGFLPWIVFAVVSGPSTWAWASGIALVISVVQAVPEYRRTREINVLTAAGVAFFAVLTLLALVLDRSSLQWVEDRAQFLSALVLALVAFGSLAAGRPFTEYYARQQVPRMFWGSPRFKRVNRVITAVWGAAFALTALCDLAVLAGGPSWLFNWVLPIVLLVGAVVFTNRYPDSVRPQPPAPVDEASDPHLSGVFAPVRTESQAADLEVVGELPSEMDGLYLRNGPNPRFTPLGSYLYPIEGDGMVHGLWVSDGRARYANRFVRTPALMAEEKAGKALWGGFATGYLPDASQVGPDLAGTFREMPDINVVRHGGRLLALAEAAPPFALTPELATIGRETFGGALPAGMTAHPKVDPETGEMAVFCYGLEAPFLTWSMIGPDGVPTRLPTVVEGVDAPIMIHDMALTRRFLVVVLAPFYFDMAAAVAGGSMLKWKPEDGTRIALIPRDGGPIRWARDEAFWTWHSANAYDDGDDPDAPVVLDFVQWTRPTGFSRASDAPVRGGLARARIDPARGSLTRDWLADTAGVEFPRVDDRRIGTPHGTIAVGATTGNQKPVAGDHDAVLWLDARTGSVTRWDAPEFAVGEPVFVPRPGDPDESHGWWVTFATDRRDDVSWFLVIPAGDPASGPVARVRIPTRVPLGLHGAWLPTQE